MEKRKMMNSRHIGNYASILILIKFNLERKIFEPKYHGNPSTINKPLKVREFKLGRNPMNVLTVEKHLSRKKTLLFIRELTLERNLMNAVNVQKPSARSQPSLHTRERIQRRSPMNAMNV
ncbi:unnamed protein product [Pipistrellus nathusii]|uniref:Uncharacterized protein n=1 Tax=Pipistrellus nathusii TaxID=59473 RepID=A0ABP0AHI4_PIPNA